MTTVELVANLLRLVGLFITVAGLWLTAGGLRVVVSGRIDERRRSASSLKWGLPILVLGIAALVGGTWLLDWARTS